MPFYRLAIHGDLGASLEKSCATMLSERESAAKEMTPINDVTKHLVAEIEMIRLKRRAEWRDRPHPEQKRFTQEEICFDPCPTYRNLLVRRSRRLPSREIVQKIADYLECSLAERNDLLICAGYLPEIIPPTNGQLAPVLVHLKAVLHQLELPAYILASDWRIYDTNAKFDALWNGAKLMDYPQHKQSLIDLIFDPALPFRGRVGTQRRQWKWHAQASVALFKERIKLRQYDHEVRQRIDGFLQFPQFREAWNAPLDHSAHADDSFECVAGSMATPMCIRYFGISLYSREYPELCVYLPGDEAARESLPIWNMDNALFLSLAAPRNPFGN